MIVSCGSCQSKFKIDPAKLPSAGAKIRCPKCKGVIAVGAQAPAPGGPAARGGAPGMRTREDARDDLAPLASGADAGAPARPNAPLVLVAHSNPAFCESLKGFLRRHGFLAEAVSEGQAALGFIRERLPRIVLVDVALTGGLVGYALCEKIKTDPQSAGVHVVLIGAIYDRSRYRRPPQSLYGSDGYLEKHEIPDKLLPMLERLVNGGTAEPEPPVAAPEPGAAPRAQGAPQPAPQAAAPVDTGAVEQARRLARIIVSDIVLYNPDAVKRGVADGNLADLLKDELKEGRELLKARMGAEAAAADYVLEALEDYMQRMASRAAGASR
jgi:predicted Zn finger-like uncharacterized protein